MLICKQCDRDIREQKRQAWLQSKESREIEELREILLYFAEQVLRSRVDGIDI